jgi:protoheme IX farnesyltransferase
MTDVRAVPLAAARTWGRRARAYVALTKPRIIELLLVTTVPAMIVAEGGLPSGTLILATVVGGTLAAGGANTFNMYADRDIDRLMERTRGRPLVTGEVEPAHALAFGVVLEVAAFGLLWGTVNLLSALLAVSACLFYVFVYTLWLKRTSRQNIVIGGAAGAVPVLVGWAAVTDELALTAWLLFNVPMLPVVVSVRTTARQMLAYTFVVAALAVVVWPVADLGWIYGAAALVASGVFLVDVARLVGDPSPRRAMRVFGFSITYLTVLFGALAADVLILQGF